MIDRVIMPTGKPTKMKYWNNDMHSVLTDPGLHHNLSVINPTLMAGAAYLFVNILPKTQINVMRRHYNTSELRKVSSHLKRNNAISAIYAAYADRNNVINDIRQNTQDIDVKARKSRSMGVN